MKLTLEDITKIFNQAIENETGIKGEVDGLFTYESYHITYSSERDVTLLTLNELDLIDNPSTSIRFVNTNSEKPNWNYVY